MIEIALNEDIPVDFFSVGESRSDTGIRVKLASDSFSGTVLAKLREDTNFVNLTTSFRNFSTGSQNIDRVEFRYVPSQDFNGVVQNVRLEVDRSNFNDIDLFDFEFIVTSIEDAPRNINITNRSVAENVAGAGVGVLTAVDPDVGDFHTFTLVGDVSGKFEISAGTLRLKAGQSLDFEEAQSHVVRVRVVDQTNRAFEKNFTINVIDEANEGVAGATGLSDVLEGTSGSDVINALGGSDFIIGSAGGDVIDGGDGVDTISYAGLQGPLTVDLGALINQAFGAGIGFDQLSNVENIIGTEQNDVIAGDAEHNVIHGEGGDDRLIGGIGHDRLYGGEGDDFIVGNQNADFIDAGPGNDRIIADGVDIEVRGGEGIDRLSILGGRGAVLDLAQSAIERAEGNSGDDIFNGTDVTSAPLTLMGNGGEDALTGGAQNDLLLGGDDADTLLGGDGIDRLFGEGGDDVLDGGLANDRIVGGAGDDVIHGGFIGNDRLVGGTGADVFVMQDRWGRDRIEGGFDVADVIRFDGVRLGGGQAIDFSDLSFDASGGNTVISVDGIGTHSVTVVGVPTSAFQEANFDFV